MGEEIKLDILNPEGISEYNKIKGQKREEYEKIFRPAWEEYLKNRHPFWEEYEKIKELEGTEQYKKVEPIAWKKCLNGETLMRGKYFNVVLPAIEEYKKSKKFAYNQIIKQEKYRNQNWE